MRDPDEGNEFCRPAPETLARVTASDLLGSEGGQPIGYALAGPLGTAIRAHTYLTRSTADIFIAASAFSLLRPLRTGTGTTSHLQTSGEPVASKPNHGPADPSTPPATPRTLSGQHSAAAFGRCARSRLGDPFLPGMMRLRRVARTLQLRQPAR